MTTTSTQPISSARFRLASDISMNVAGRKMVESTSTPARPARSASSAASTSRVTSSVLPSGCFSTISSRPGPSLMTPSPIGGGKPSTTSATSPSRRSAGVAGPAIDRRRDQGHRAEIARGPHRRRVGDGQPLVGRVHEAARGHRHGVAGRRRPPPASVTPLARSRSGSTSTWSCRSRWPQIATLATPDRHQARADRPPRQRRSAPSATASSTTCRSSSPG